MNTSISISECELDFIGYDIQNDCEVHCRYRFNDRSEVKRFINLVRRVYISRAKKFADLRESEEK